MSEWPIASLGALVDIRHGFAFKGEHITEKATENLLLTPGNFAIGGGFQFKKRKYYAGEVPPGYILEGGELIVTMTDLSKEADTLGYSAIVPSSELNMLHNQRIGRVTLKTDETSLDFIHWVMRTPEYRNEILANYSGSTVKHTSPSKILAHQFTLPPIGEQREIAATLDALDDKIELNRKTAATLEEIARALYRSWFVDFDPAHARAEGRAPAHMDSATAALFPDSFGEDGLPTGWRKASIYEIARVQYGAPFASAKFNASQQGRPLVRIRDLKNHEAGVWTTEVHRTEYLIQPGDIVVGMDGDFTPYTWCASEALMNQRVCCFIPLDESNRAYLRYSVPPLLKAEEEAAVATTVIHLGKKDIDKFQVILGQGEVMQAFSKRLMTTYRKIVALGQETRILSTLRDTLLPGLMSGELRVGAARELIEDAA